MPNISNGAMFGDVDGPLNASRGFVSIQLSFLIVWVIVCEHTHKNGVDRITFSVVDGNNDRNVRQRDITLASGRTHLFNTSSGRWFAYLRCLYIRLDSTSLNSTSLRVQSSIVGVEAPLGLRSCHLPIVRWLPALYSALLTSYYIYFRLRFHVQLMALPSSLWTTAAGAKWA